MSRKMLAVCLAGMMVLLPFQGQLLAAPVVITAQGQVTLTATFSAIVKKVSDNSTVPPTTGITFPAGVTYAKGDNYLDVSFNDNTVGYRAVTIATDNRNTAASPKYSGIAQGSGLVGNGTATTAKDYAVPMLWMVDKTLISGGYTFTGAPGEYYVQDTLQGTRTDNDPALGASSCNDINKNKTCDAGEYDDLNTNSAYNPVVWNGTAAQNLRCRKISDGTFVYAEDACPTGYYSAADPANGKPKFVEGVDWDGDGYDGAKPYSQGFGAIVFGLSGLSGALSGAAGATIDETRTTTTGNVKVYLGVNYAGAPGQAYKTSRLLIDVVTIS